MIKAFFVSKLEKNVYYTNEPQCSFARHNGVAALATCLYRGHS